MINDSVCGCAATSHQVNVVKAITQILPTGGPPASIIEKDIKAGEAILQIIGGVLIPTSEVHFHITSSRAQLMQLHCSLLPMDSVLQSGW